jgi:hypothetical protein
MGKSKTAYVVGMRHGHGGWAAGAAPRGDGHVQGKCGPPTPGRAFRLIGCVPSWWYSVQHVARMCDAAMRLKAVFNENTLFCLHGIYR